MDAWSANICLARNLLIWEDLTVHHNIHFFFLFLFLMNDLFVKWTYADDTTKNNNNENEKQQGSFKPSQPVHAQNKQ